MNFIKIGQTVAKPVHGVMDRRLKEFCFGSYTTPSNSLIHKSFLWFQHNNTKESYDTSCIVWTGFSKNKQGTNTKIPEQNNASFQNVHTGL